MARGLPGLWSLLLGGGIVGIGGYLWQSRPSFSLIALATFVLLGLVIAVLGLYVQFVAAPDPPEMFDDEELLDTRTPAPHSAAIKSVIGLLLLGTAVFMFYFLHYPNIYTGVGLLLGGYLFVTGLYTYWTNTLIVYYVTTQRVIKEYRFLSLVRSEIGFDDIQGVEQHRSITGVLTGLGTIRVRSGAQSLEILIEDIYDTTEFAELLRNQM